MIHVARLVGWLSLTCFVACPAQSASTQSNGSTTATSSVPTVTLNVVSPAPSPPDMAAYRIVDESGSIPVFAGPDPLTSDVVAVLADVSEVSGRVIGDVLYVPLEDAELDHGYIPLSAVIPKQGLEFRADQGQFLGVVHALYGDLQEESGLATWEPLAFQFPGGKWARPDRPYMIRAEVASGETESGDTAPEPRRLAQPREAQLNWPEMSLALADLAPDFAVLQDGLSVGRFKPRGFRPQEGCSLSMLLRGSVTSYGPPMDLRTPRVAMVPAPPCEVEWTIGRAVSESEIKDAVKPLLTEHFSQEWMDPQYFEDPKLAGIWAINQLGEAPSAVATLVQMAPGSSLFLIGSIDNDTGAITWVHQNRESPWMLLDTGDYDCDGQRDLILRMSFSWGYIFKWMSELADGEWVTRVVGGGDRCPEVK